MDKLGTITASMDRKLNILVEGESLVFSIRVELGGNVSDLKKVVHQNRGDLQSILRDHQRLAVLKVDIDLDPYSTDVESLGFLEASNVGLLLLPWETISHLWPNQPPYNQLHVIVKLPIGTPLKRSNPDGYVERLKRSKLATLAPSVIAQPSEYRSIQNHSSQRILDDRPERDGDLPPVSLIYDGFGHFLDIFHGHKSDVPGLSDISLTELQDRVDAFADSMCLFYAIEDDRRDAGTPNLNSIFAARSGVTTIPELWPGTIDSAVTNGHNIGMHGAPGVVVEYKNWPANSGCIPQVEVAGYVARSHARFVSDELIRRWRIPTLGLTIVGAEIRFYGIVVLGHQYRSVALTPALSCIAASTEGWERNALYNAFSAASVLLARIHQDARRFVRTLPPEIPDGTHHFPDVTKLRKWQSSGFLEFQINSFYGDRLPTRLLFTASTMGSNSTTILVKFARNYSIDVHQFCAAIGRAPTILGFEALPGGWCAIAMDFVASAVPITESIQIAVHRERWAKELLELVQALHKAGFVHGDLRDVNIICAGAIMMLVDFDWAGWEGKAAYPHLRLNSALLDGRDSKDLKITKEDDMRVLVNTLKKLRS